MVGTFGLGMGPPRRSIDTNNAACAGMLAWRAPLTGWLTQTLYGHVPCDPAVTAPQRPKLIAQWKRARDRRQVAVHASQEVCVGIQHPLVTEKVQILCSSVAIFHVPHVSIQCLRCHGVDAVVILQITPSMHEEIQSVPSVHNCGLVAEKRCCCF